MSEDFVAEFGGETENGLWSRIFGDGLKLRLGRRC